MSDPLVPNLVPFNTEPSLVFDAFDLDLVLKVLNNTAFSEPALDRLDFNLRTYANFERPILHILYSCFVSLTGKGVWYAGGLLEFCMVRCRHGFVFVPYTITAQLTNLQALALCFYRDSPNVFRHMEKRLEI